MATLWWSSSQEPADHAPNVMRAFLHNGMHIIAYGALAGSWVLARQSDASLTGGSRHRDIVWPLVLATAYGVIDEWHQSYVPGRVCSVSDLLSDACGGMLAIAILHALLRRGRLAAWLLPAILVACFGSVSLATWGPW